MNLTVRVRHEDSSYWAEVIELPGCFATSDSLDELKQSLEEAVRLYLAGEDEPGEPAMIEVAEMKIATSAKQPA